MHLFNLQIDDTDNDFTIMFYGLLRLQAPSAPSFMLMGNMVTDAIVISIVIFATNISLAKTFSKRNNYVIDSNQVGRYKCFLVVNY